MVSFEGDNRTNLIITFFSLNTLPLHYGKEIESGFKGTNKK